MLLRCESLEPPMSQLGQKRKCSQRADDVRFPPQSDRTADAVLCRLRANRDRWHPFLIFIKLS